MSAQLNVVNCFIFNQSEATAHNFLSLFLSVDHTKALIGQLIIFNQILGELRQDIREQASVVSSVVSSNMSSVVSSDLSSVVSSVVSSDLSSVMSSVMSSDVSCNMSSVVSSGEGDGSDQEQYLGVSGLW